MNLVAIRLLNQQLCAPQFTTPAEVVSHMGAIQAQDYRMMRWAVTMRTKKPSAEAFGKAFDSGQIIRAHLMRGTWQLISADNYRWMHHLLAPKSKTVIKGWMSANHISIPDSELADIRQLLVSTTARLTSAVKEDYAETLIQHGITMDDHRLTYHIRFAELDGVLCSGNLHPSKATYALAGQKIPQSPNLDYDEALALLARIYFQSHCPATLEDFAWWSGLGLSACRKALSMIESELTHCKWNSYDFVLTDNCRTKGYRNGQTLLIPPFDEYLIGYKSRDLVLAPENRHLAHNNSGIFYPIIAHNGTICGNWSTTKKGCQPVFFKDADIPEPQSLNAEIERFEKYKG